jgi:hypothetical protein
MNLAPEKRNAFLLVLLAAAATFLLAYLVVGKGMNTALMVAVLAVVFLLCFFSVKVSLILLLCSMLLSPEIAIGSTAARAITIRLEDILLLIMTVGWLLRMAIFKDLGFSFKTPLNGPIILFLGITVLSTTLGIWRGDVALFSGLFFALKLFEYFVLFFVVINYVRDVKDINLLITVMLGVCAVVCMYGLFQIATGGDVSAPFEGSRAERNTLGGYLVLMGSLAGGLALKTDSRIERILLMAFLPVIVIVLLYSMSRSGWMSALASGITLLFFARNKAIYLFILIVSIVLIVFFAPTPVADRYEYTFNQELHPGQQVQIFGLRFDTSTSARLLGYVIILQQVLVHPVFGYGITGYGFCDGQYFRFLIELGIVGLLSFLILMGAVHRLLRKNFSQVFPARLEGMIAGVYAGFWGLLVHSLSANSFIIVRISEPFWCLVGLTTVTGMALQSRLDLIRVSGPEPGQLLPDETPAEAAR